MDAQRVDALAKALATALATGLSRRTVLKTLAGSTAGGLLALLGLRRAAAHPVRTLCRPAEAIFPDKPPLRAPFRAVTDQDATDPATSACVPPGTRRNVLPVTTGYGQIETHTDHYHNEYYALDFSTGTTFPVLAAAAGTLRRHDAGGGVGLHIQHNAYWQTTYLHLSPCGLIRGPDGINPIRRYEDPDHPGETVPVVAGQLLGWAGNCDGTCGIHLHFALRGGDARLNRFITCASNNPDPTNCDDCGCAEVNQQTGQCIACISCCPVGNCNWSYPVNLPGVAIPAGSEPEVLPCPPQARCVAFQAADAPAQAIACCPITTIPGIVLPTAGTVTVTAVSAETSCDAAFGIDSPILQTIFSPTKRHLGESVVLGPFEAGTRPVFWFQPRPGSVCATEKHLSTDPTRARVLSQGSGSWRVGWEDWIDADYNDFVVQVTLGAAPVAGVPTTAPAEADLGTRWDENECGCVGVWTRRDTTNVFDARWTNCGVTAVLTITLNGNQVAVQRRQSIDGNDCDYDGTLAADGGSVSGTYHCTRINTCGTWHATITAKGSSA